MAEFESPLLTPSSSDLVEIWGDTVDVGHLRKAIAIGAVISLSLFWVARQVIATFIRDGNVAKTYAMLAGLIGCLLAGALCAVLFPPKRVLTESMDDTAWQRETLAQLAAENGSLGSVSDLPAAAAQEMRDLQLDALFSLERDAAASSRAVECSR